MSLINYALVIQNHDQIRKRHEHKNTEFIWFEENQQGFQE